MSEQTFSDEVKSEILSKFNERMKKYESAVGSERMILAQDVMISLIYAEEEKLGLSPQPGDDKPVGDTIISKYPPVSGNIRDITVSGKRIKNAEEYSDLMQAAEDYVKQRKK